MGGSLGGRVDGWWMHADRCMDGCAGVMCHVTEVDGCGGSHDAHVMMPVSWRMDGV
jgi:hypothetical protein